MYDIFPNYVLRPFYPPQHGVPGSSQRKGVRNSTGTAFYVDQEHPKADDNNKGWDAEFPLETIQAAIDKAEDFDWVVVMPGFYVEELVIDKPLTLLGNGRGGASVIFADIADSVGITIQDDYVTIMNMMIVADDVGVFIDDANNAQFHNCRFNASDDHVHIDGNNILFRECVFWGGENGIAFVDDSANIVVKDCLFSNISDAHIVDGTAEVLRLTVKDCVFEGSPTKFLDIDTAGTTGIVANCAIAHATNATDVIDLAAGVMWVANYTEAGVTAARPT